MSRQRPSPRWPVLAALALSACAAAGGTQLKGSFEVAGEQTLQALQEGSVRPMRTAIVIGINRYDDPAFADLSYAQRDAEAMRDVLLDPALGGFDEVRVLVGEEETTQAHILATVGRVGNRTQRRDSLLVYFSGHGTLHIPQPESGAAPAGEPPVALHPRPVLVARDTRLDALQSTGIDLIALGRQLQQIPARSKVLILDSCFSGEGKSALAADEAALMRASEGVWTVVAEGMPESGALLLATALGQPARESAALEHGVFTWFLAEGLRSWQDVDMDGDGAVNVYEAFDYARARTLSESQDAQQPEAFLRVGGLGTFYLSHPPEGAPPTLPAYIMGHDRGVVLAKGVSVEIDGEDRGALPRNIPVEPGGHRISLRDERGHALYSGRMRFGEGQILTLGGLIAALQTPRRVFSLSVGQVRSAQGQAADVFGSTALRGAVGTGLRVRGGWLRGLGLDFELGLEQTRDGGWADLSDASRRLTLDGGARLGMYRRVGRWQLGGGWGIQGMVAAPLEASQGDASCADGQVSPLCLWLAGAHGPSLSAGFLAHQSLMLGVEPRLWLFGPAQGLAGYDDAELDPNRQVSVMATVSLGF